MVLCRDWTVVKERAGVTTAEPLKCRCWSCDYCQPARINQLKGLARAGAPDTFLTLTANPKRGHSPDDRARGLARAWRLLRLRAMRHYGYRSLPFLAVFEKTKRGEPHLHILLRVRWLDQRWVSAQMRGLTSAPICDIRRVKGAKQAAAYVAKYVGKEPCPFKGTKRYWRSQDWDLTPTLDEDAWFAPADRVEIHKCTVDHWLHWEGLMGMKVEGQKGSVYEVSWPAREHPPPPPPLSEARWKAAGLHV